MNSFKRFDDDKLSARKYFFSSTKKGKIDNDGKISDSHIGIKDYMTCEKILCLILKIWMITMITI